MDTTAKSLDFQTLCGEGLLIHDYSLERSVLASLMASYSNLQEVQDILTPDCFFDLKNREIYKTIEEIYRKGEMPDMIIVGNELAKKNSTISKFEITELCVNETVVFDLRRHSLLLKEFSFRRKLWEIGQMLIMKSGNQADDLELIQNEAKKSIDSVFEDSGSDLLTLAETYKSLQEKLLVRMSQPEGYMEGTRTGFQELDSNGGLVGGDLIVVGAETSQGKTSFATALALNAMKNGNKVAFYSMEMTNEQLTIRLASMLSGLNSMHIKNDRITMEELYRIDEAMSGIDLSLLHFDDKSFSTLDHILLSIRNQKMKYDIQGVVVDYLQLVNISDRSMTREQGVARIARDLKNLAKELNIWIIAISQLKRNDSNPIPTMSRLRDSGQIEEAADHIFLIYRPRDWAKYPEPFTDIPTTGTAMVKIAKGRNAEIKEFICGFKPENTLFYPLSKEEIERLKRDGKLIISYSSSGIDEETPF